MSGEKPLKLGHGHTPKQRGRGCKYLQLLTGVRPHLAHLQPKGHILAKRHRWPLLQGQRLVPLGCSTASPCGRAAALAASIPATGFVLSLQTAVPEPSSQPGSPHGITSPPQHRHAASL